MNGKCSVLQKYFVIGGDAWSILKKNPSTKRNHFKNLPENIESDEWQHYILYVSIYVCTLYIYAALQIRAGQRSITTNLWPMTTHIYHVMIIVTSGISKKSFFIIIFRNSLTQMFFKAGVIRNFAIFTGKSYNL